MSDNFLISKALAEELKKTDDPVILRLKKDKRFNELIKQRETIDAEIKELISAVGEVRRILRDSANKDCIESKNRLQIVSEIMKKLEIK